MEISKGCSRGFTLIEILIVIAIMGILASIAVPAYTKYIDMAQSAACLAERDVTDKMIMLYCNDNPDTELKSLSQLVGKGYLDSEPKCPYGGEYLLVSADKTDSGYPKVGCSIHHWPAPFSGGDLFSDSFDNMDSLTPLRGKWGIKDGTLVTIGGGEHCLAFGDEDWTDYEVKANAALFKGQGYGVYYRADGERNITGYCLQYDPGYGEGAFLVRKVKDGKEQSPFQRVPMPEGFPVYDQSHEIDIAVEGDHHVIKIDGDTILDFHDDTFTSGSAGFRSWGSSEVGFENVAVSKTG